jgi:hypothetical protein
MFIHDIFVEFKKKGLKIDTMALHGELYYGSSKDAAAYYGITDSVHVTVKRKHIFSLILQQTFKIITEQIFSASG